MWINGIRLNVYFQSILQAIGNLITRRLFSMWLSVSRPKLIADFSYLPAVIFHPVYWCLSSVWFGIGQLVHRLATGGAIRGPNLSEGEIFRTGPVRS